MQGAFLQIFSMFLIMALGVLIRVKGLLSKQAIKELNHVTISILFPALFFMQMVTLDLASVFDVRFILAANAVLILTYLLSLLVGKLMSPKDEKRQVAITQVIYVANLVVVGIPMVGSYFEGNPLAATYNGLAMMVLFFALFYHNIIPITRFEMVSGSTLPMGKIILNVFKNPIVISIVAAAIVNLIDTSTGLNFFKSKEIAPQFILKPLGMLGHAAPVMVFLSIGYNMNFNLEKSAALPLAVATLTSLILVPILTFFICYFFKLPADQALIIVIMFASPTAPYLYNLMVPYDLRLEMVQYTVVTTMIGYLVIMPLFLWLFPSILKVMGMA